MRKITPIILFVAIILTIGTVISRSFRVGQIPNGGTSSCLNCHNSASGGDARNDFGQQVEAHFLIDGNVNWGPLLASLDADNDGVTNGEELQDPFGLWTTGSPAPGNQLLVTLPGSSSSNNFSTLKINFSGMTPHVGQKLYLRVVDKLNMSESGRTIVPSITESFTLSLDWILPGHSYNIDFFADANGNGLYDTPPVDHAWRMELNNAAGNEEINFAHNTNFMDINWPYLFTIKFSGMTPHIGQLLELRISDDITGQEIGRDRIEMISADAFNISIPGIELGKKYSVDFYADFNKNGVYDAPPADHAWNMKFENTTGDFDLEFSHNTDFTDINWNYLYTLNFSGMTPHIGQKFEMRVVSEDGLNEVGRISIDQLPSSEFIISIPGIENNQNYNADFYADFNNSGQYEAPPADHAWRVSFNTGPGNYVQNFSHNTDFTDIQWPVTDIKDEVGNNIPKNYSLSQNYPNPFNPATTIRYSVPAIAQHVTLKVFDMLGNEVTTLVNESQAAGNYEVQFNAEGLASGIYIYTIRANNFNLSKKMLLLK